MASAYVASLITARDAAAVQLATILSAPNPKPSYSVEGRSISWESYIVMLSGQVDSLTKSIAAADGGQDSSHHVGHGRGCW